MKLTASGTPHRILAVGRKPAEDRALFKGLGLAIALAATATTGCAGGASAETGPDNKPTYDRTERNGATVTETAPGTTSIVCYNTSGAAILRDVVKDRVYWGSGHYSYTSRITGDELKVPVSDCYVTKKAAKPG